MWTLVLFTLFGNPNSGGGTYANVSTFQFSTEKYCLEAAKILEAQGTFANTAFSISDSKRGRSSQILCDRWWQWR
jgi:hypothetical protein